MFHDTRTVVVVHKYLSLIDVISHGSRISGRDNRWILQIKFYFMFDKSSIP